MTNSGTHPATAAVPLGFALGVSPGPRLGARDPEGNDALETLARDGVNLIRLPKIDEGELDGVTPGRGPLPPSVQHVADQLDWAHRAGQAAGRAIYVAINLGELSAPDGGPIRRRWLDYVVRRFREHPAAGVWKMLDEPNNPYTPDDKERELRVGLRRGYRRIRELDTAHPCWVTQAPQPPRRVTLRYLRAYRDAADIHAIDLYPVSDPIGKHSGIRNTQPSAVGDYAARLAALARECTVAGQPRWVWMVLQGAGWSGVVPRDERRRPMGPVLMQPTAAMLRYMTWHAIACGAQGLLYFGMNVGLYPDMAPLGWDWGYWRGAVVPLLRELRSAAVAPALAACAPGPAEVIGTPSGPRITTRFLPSPERPAVLVATRSERRRGEPAEATVRLLLSSPASPAGTTVEVCFEHRSARVLNGAVEDAFIPHQVHVYCIASPTE